MKTKSFKLSDETITLISTDLDDINVIPIQEYIIDIKKRVEINNHEVITLIRDSYCLFLWFISEVVITLACHASITGSNPVWTVGTQYRVSFI